MSLGMSGKQEGDEVLQVLPGGPVPTDVTAQALPAQCPSGRNRRGQNSWPEVLRSSGPQAFSTGQSSWPG